MKNGYLNPRFIINKGGNDSLAIDLTLAEELIETYETVKTSNEFKDLSCVTEQHGFRIHFTIDYHLQPNT